MIGTEGGLAPLGDAGELGIPLGLDLIGLGVGLIGVDGGAPDPGHLLHIGGAALASLDLD